MSPTLRTLVERLRRDVLAAHAHLFEKGRARQPALADHAAVGSVLDVLSDDREQTYPTRDALTQALLAEYHQSDHSLWSSILVVAYYPMLSRLRHRLFSDAVPREELDQIVLTAFLAALAELSLDERCDRVAMRLRQRTERQVFQVLRKEREQEHPDVDLDELAVVSTELIQPRHLETTAEERFDLALLLKRAREEGIPASSLEVVTATLLQREPLRSYVDRVGPGDEPSRERMYQRLKRQRTRVLTRLRALLAESPAAQVSGF